jgi:hypothetical protein
MWTRKPGRPARKVWPDLHIVQVVKQYAGKRLVGLQRRVVHGCRDRVDDVITMSQCGLGLINTAFIERSFAHFLSRAGQ